MTAKEIAALVDQFLPLAFFIFFLSYVAFEVIHLIHSPGWNWRRTAKGCVEAFAFFVLSIPIIVGVSSLASRIADRFSFDSPEESAVRRYLALAVLIPLLLCWNGRRWRRVSKGKASNR